MNEVYTASWELNKIIFQNTILKNIWSYQPKVKRFLPKVGFFRPEFVVQ